MNLRDAWHLVTSAMSSWHQGKLFVEHTISIDHDALHMIVGVLAFFGFGALLRRPLSSWSPWLWVLALILWNEAVDLWVERWPDPGMQYGEGAKDVLMTMVIPTVLLVAIRFAPGLFRAKPGRR